MVLLKKGSHDAIRKDAHNFGASTPSLPVYNLLVGQEDFANIKEKLIGDLVNESSVVGDHTPNTANNKLSKLH